MIIVEDPGIPLFEPALHARPICNDPNFPVQNLALSGTRILRFVMPVESDIVRARYKERIGPAFVAIAVGSGEAPLFDELSLPRSGSQ